VNLYKRFTDHLYHNNQSNTHLQAAIALYGLENFEYFVISFVTDKGLLIKEEQKYMDMVPSSQRYNFCPSAGSCLGVVRSAETKAAISAARLGTTRSAETKAAISESLKGNTNRLGTTHSAETKAAISESLKGEKSPIFGKSPSAETKAAMSEAHKGEKNPIFGKSHSAEAKAAISAAHSKAVYVYDSNKVLVDTFPSRTAAIKEYSISSGTIYRLLDSKKLWNNLYYFTTTPLAP